MFRDDKFLKVDDILDNNCFFREVFLIVKELYFLYLVFV